MLSLVPLLAVGAATEDGVVVYQYYIDLLYNKTDRAPAFTYPLCSAMSQYACSCTCPCACPSAGNNDGALQPREFEHAFYLMGMICRSDPPPEDPDKCLTVSQMNTEFGIADANSDNAVTEAEIRDYFERYKDMSSSSRYGKLGRQFVVGLTGVPDPDTFESAISIDDLPTRVVDAKKIVRVAFTVSSNPEEIMAGTRQRLKSTLIALMNANPPLRDDEVIMTITAGSSNVELSAFFVDEQQASSATANVQTALSSPQAATSQLGVPVTSAVLVSEAEPPGSGDLDTATALLLGIVTVVLVCLSFIIASRCASKQRKAKGVPIVGCCSTGCCSTNAIKGWASNELLAVLFLLVASFLLYDAMKPATDALVCIIDEIFRLREVSSADARKAVEDLDDTLDLIDPFRPYIDLLSVFSIVPAVLAAITVACGSLCACKSCHKFSKFFNFVGYIILELCSIFYIVFVIIGPIVKQPFADEMFSKITALCEVTQPLLQQTFADAQTAVTRFSGTPGVNQTELAEWQQRLTDAEEPLEVFETLCDCVTKLFASFIDLFAPGIACLLATIYAQYTATFTCWTGGCCVSFKKADRTSVNCCGWLTCLLLCPLHPLNLCLAACCRSADSKKTVPSETKTEESKVAQTL